MRPPMLATLVLIAIVALGLQSRATPIRAGESRRIVVKSGNAKTVIAAPRVETPPAIVASWTVESTWMKSREYADRDALHEAWDRVILYLRSSEAPVEWTPSLEYVRQHLVRDRHEELREFGLGVGSMVRVSLEVAVTTKDREDMLNQEHHFRKQQRMLDFGAVLAFVVASLATLAGYIQFDERTKGFYRGRLRMAAFAFLLLVGGGISLMVIQ